MWVASGRRNSEPMVTLHTSDPLEQRGSFHCLVNNTYFTALVGEESKLSLWYHPVKKENNMVLIMVDQHCCFSMGVIILSHSVRLGESSACITQTEDHSQGVMM